MSPSAPCDCRAIAEDVRAIKRLVLASSVIGPTWRFSTLVSLSALGVALASLAASVLR